MKKIASFTVNHDTLVKGMYISRIEFVHPINKEVMSFNAPLPPAFREFFGK